ncbi:MAG: class I SAM-dependent methyltransferase [Hamadaea sp.]|nr:class I SAM-dependent methyltransferase [Hamadaea sp.]
MIKRGAAPATIPLGCDLVTETWLADTRTSYDTVASAYADVVRDFFTALPQMRAALTLFADLVTRDGGGPVADVGCGPGHVTAALHGLGVDAFGIDLSPGMIDLARREHPELRFEVGSMTDLDLADGSLAGLIAWWSLIHIPDEAIPGVLAGFRRVLRPGGLLQVGFHVGEDATLKTSGYGGQPMHVYVYRRSVAVVSDRLREAGFRIEASWLLGPDEERPGAVIFARGV